MQSAYSFIDTPIHCTLCQEIVSKPVNIRESQVYEQPNHDEQCQEIIYCRRCIERTCKGEELKCPQCNDKGNRSDIKADRQCRQLMRACRMKCERRSGPNDLPMYPSRPEAPYELGRMPSTRCAWTGARSGIHTHNLECGFMKVRCRDCQQEYLRRELRTHQRTNCAGRTVKCKHCGKDMDYATRQEHQDKCPHKLTACEYKVIGCSWVGEWRRYSSHLCTKEGLDRHLDLALYEIQQLHKIRRIRALTQQQEEELQRTDNLVHDLVQE